MDIEIVKCHGSGNDFILIDDMDSRYGLNNSAKEQLALTLCDRKTGIGADGILFIEDSEMTEATMRIFNADGSEADMCANGLRIAGRYVTEKNSSSKIGVQNITNLKYGILNENEIFENVAGIEVSMPPVNFRTEQIPVVYPETEATNVLLTELDPDLIFTAASLPNPHIISFVDKVEEKKLIAIGKKANELKTVFPKGVNVSFVRIIDSTLIYAGTYERGVGITNSCGTAMFASVACAIKNDLLYFNTEIKVVNKGGYVIVLVQEDWGGTMKGNATYIFKSTVSWNEDSPGHFTETERTNFPAETSAYNKLADSVQPVIAASNI